MKAKKVGIHSSTSHLFLMDGKIEDERKADVLTALERFKRQGYKLTREFRLQDDLDDMSFELAYWRRFQQVERSRKHAGGC